jgi:hypothetical protein
MAKVNRKKGMLTPGDLAVYGIPPKELPSNDPDLKVSDGTEKKPADFNRGPAVLKRIAGDR